MCGNQNEPLHDIWCGGKGIIPPQTKHSLYNKHQWMLKSRMLNNCCVQTMMCDEETYMLSFVFSPIYQIELHTSMGRLETSFASSQVHTKSFNADLPSITNNWAGYYKQSALLRQNVTNHNTTSGGHHFSYPYTRTIVHAESAHKKHILLHHESKLARKRFIIIRTSSRIYSHGKKKKTHIHIGIEISSNSRITKHQHTDIMHATTTDTRSV